MKHINGQMAIVVLRKQTGFNQDFEFRCLGGKYQDLFYQSGFRDTADFFKQDTKVWILEQVISER